MNIEFIVNKLKELKRLRGFTYEDIAVRTGITRQGVAMTFTGKNIDIGITKLSKLCKALNTDIYSLLNATPPEQTRNFKEIIEDPEERASICNMLLKYGYVVKQSDKTIIATKETK